MDNEEYEKEHRLDDDVVFIYPWYEFGGYIPVGNRNNLKIPQETPESYDKRFLRENKLKW